MITDFIVSMLLGVVRGVFSIIPAWSVDTSTIDSAKQAGLGAGSLDGWFPETFLFACLTVVLAVRLWFLVWNGVQWVYHLIPFNGG